MYGDLGLFSYGAPEWDIAQLWVFTKTACPCAW